MLFSGCFLSSSKRETTDDSILDYVFVNILSFHGKIDTFFITLER